MYCMHTHTVFLIFLQLLRGFKGTSAVAAETIARFRVYPRKDSFILFPRFWPTHDSGEVTFCSALEVM